MTLVLVDWQQSTKVGGPAPAHQAKIDDRSGNVDENKGQLTSAAGQREVPAPSEQPVCATPVGATTAEAPVSQLGPPVAATAHDVLL